MEKEKLSDFEEYLHNKILTIYGKTDDNTEKNEQNVMGSLIIPKNIIGLINEHNNSFKKFNNYPESYLKSQNFYDNLMISLKKNKNILKNCCRISTKSGFPNLKKFSRKKHDEIQPSNFTYQVFETINKDDINNEYSENKNMDLGAIKKARPMSTKNLTNNQPVIYDSFQKKHIERINSARDLKKEDIIKKKNTIKTISNENNSNIALKRRKSKLKNFQVNEKFPAWILERSDFQNKLQSPEFNLNYKILKICEKQYFKRSTYDKDLISHYLKKINFFKFFSDSTLDIIALKLESKFFPINQIIGSHDDVAESLMIVYEGEILAIHKDKFLAKYKKNDVVSRHFFTNEKKTYCMLKTQNGVSVLILSKLEYEPIFKNLISNEYTSFKNFISKMPIVKLLEEEKIQELLRNCNIKTHFKNEIIFRKGEYADNFYMIKGGCLRKSLIVYIENKYKWPMIDQQWFLKKIVKTIKYPLKFNQGDFVGFEEFISGNLIRKETLEVEEDCLLLELNRSKFFEIFEGKCMALFKEYYNKKLISWEEDSQMNLKAEDESLQKNINFLKNAMQGNSKNDSFSKQNKIKNWLKYFEKKSEMAKGNREIIAVNKYEKKTISKYET